tara:strand:- start:6874 stop:7656 length:783 start_codon:yes stop_codon:yes gene_type:complete
MSGLFYRIGSEDEVPPVVKVDTQTSGTDTSEATEGMLERAKNLSIDGGRGQNLKAAVEFQIKQDEAAIQALKSPYYQFIMKVAGFSNEPISKFWKDESGDKTQAQPLVNTPNISQIAQINAAVGAEGGEDGKELAEYLKTRQYFLQSVGVRGYLFLTPICYSHLCEAVSLLEKFCHTKIDVDQLVQSDHSTYFARLVSLRIQMSRFLSGRYYSLSANYDRLRAQQGYLMKYFKANLGTGASGSTFHSQKGSGLFDSLQGF